MHSVSGKVIVITGAAGGMGLDASKYLAAQGAKVSISDVQEGPLQQAAAEIEQTGGNVLHTVVDVRDRKAVEAWIQKTTDAFGKIDSCVNLAGVAARQHGIANIEQIDDDDWDFVQAINVKGVLNCMRAQIPQMNDGGSIVNAASVAGLVGFAGVSAYCASKHAVVGITKSAAKELGPRNIRCNCICPGLIDTPMLRDVGDKGNITADQYKKRVPLGRLGTPRDITHLVEWLLCDGSDYITGTAIRIDGGMVDY